MSLKWARRSWKSTFVKILLAHPPHCNHASLFDALTDQAKISLVCPCTLVGKRRDKHFFLGAKHKYFVVNPMRRTNPDELIAWVHAWNPLPTTRVTVSVFFSILLTWFVVGFVDAMRIWASFQKKTLSSVPTARVRLSRFVAGFPLALCFHIMLNMTFPFCSLRRILRCSHGQCPKAPDLPTCLCLMQCFLQKSTGYCADVSENAVFMHRIHPEIDVLAPRSIFDISALWRSFLVSNQF